MLTTVFTYEWDNFSYRFVVRNLYIPRDNIHCSYQVDYNSTTCEIIVSSAYISSYKFSEHTSEAAVAHIDRQVRHLGISVLVKYRYSAPVFAFVVESADNFWENSQREGLDLWNCFTALSVDDHVGCSTKLLKRILSFSLPTYCKFDYV